MRVLALGLLAALIAPLALAGSASADETGLSSSFIPPLYRDKARDTQRTLPRADLRTVPNLVVDASAGKAAPVASVAPALVAAAGE